MDELVSQGDSCLDAAVQASPGPKVNGHCCVTSDCDQCARTINGPRVLGGKVVDAFPNGLHHDRDSHDVDDLALLEPEQLQAVFDRFPERCLSVLGWRKHLARIEAGRYRPIGLPQTPGVPKSDGLSVY